MTHSPSKFYWEGNEFNVGQLHRFYAWISATSCSAI